MTKTRLPKHPMEPQSYDWGFWDGFVDARARQLPPWWGREHPDKHYARGYRHGGEFWANRNRRTE
jgi:hypothetical protein